MWRARRVVMAGLTMVCLVWGFPNVARAATTVGPPLTASPDGGTVDCGADACTVLGPSSPVDGVLVGVRMRSAANAQLRIKVVRDTGAGGWQLVGETLRSEWAAPDAPSQRVSPVPLRAGDVIAVTSPNPFPSVTAISPGSATRLAAHPYVSGYWDGTAFPAPTRSLADRELQMQATIEPDRDRDGYGDESQDLCPTEPSIHETKCQSDLVVDATVPQSALVGAPVRHTFVIRNAGPHRAPDVRVAFRFWGTPRPVGGPQACRAPSGDETRRAMGATAVCPIGDLGVGESVVLTLDGVAGKTGLSESITPLTDAVDPVQQPALHGTQVIRAKAFTPELGGGDQASRKLITLRGASLTVKVGCPKRAPSRCAGRVDLAIVPAIGKLRRVRGGAYAADPGTWTKVRIAVPRAVRARVRARRSANVSFEATWSAGTETRTVRRRAALMAP